MIIFLALTGFIFGTLAFTQKTVEKNYHCVKYAKTKKPYCIKYKKIAREKK